MSKIYVWDKEVKEIKGTTVNFTDGTTWEYTETNLKYLQTKKPKDASELQMIIINNVVNDMLSVVFNHNIKNSDLQTIINKLAMDYNKNVDDALCKKLWVDSLWCITAHMVSKFKNT